MANDFYRIITLTNANQNYSLYSLMVLVDANVARNFMQLQISAPDSNTNNIALGANTMAGITDGDQLFPTSSRNLESSNGKNEISVTNKFVRSDAAGQKLFIRGMCH